MLEDGERGLRLKGSEPKNEKSLWAARAARFEASSPWSSVTEVAPGARGGAAATFFFGEVAELLGALGFAP